MFPTCSIAILLIFKVKPEQMRTKEETINLLDEISELMVLNRENHFKINAFKRAETAIISCQDFADRVQNGTLTELLGIGDSIAAVIGEFVMKGTSSQKDALVAKLPKGFLELTKIPGIGPSKARAIIKELGIHSLKELEEACKQNRLAGVRGFSEKSQIELLEMIHFLDSTTGRVRLVNALSIAARLKEFLCGTAGKERRIYETGELRRRLEVIAKLEFIVELSKDEGDDFRSRILETLGRFIKDEAIPLPVELYFAYPEEFIFQFARTTGNEKHWVLLGSPSFFNAKTEEEFYEKLDLPWISPEMREGGDELRIARSGKLDEILPVGGVKGIFHVHTTYSDGLGTMEEMICQARSMGYQYIGIADHSKSVTYAGGLKIEDLERQKQEIAILREKYPEIRIFWGIESDILQDGSLDYEDDVLEKFDFVISSIHSRFKMDRETMTKRVIAAIRSPYTRFFAHPTGRMLLERKGYELDMEHVIREAAKNDVAIELNAHPSRYDVDWRWGAVLREHRAFISINPDAHRLSGFEYIPLGEIIARKALMPSAQVLNSLPVKEVENWLRKK